MAVIDSYSESNQNARAALGSDSVSTPRGLAGGYGVCFTGDGQKITDTQWYLAKLGTLITGNAVAKIWTMTGTFGTNGNVGSLLATSDNVNVATIGGSLALVTFPFSGANQYVTTNGTRYVSTVEYTTGLDDANCLDLGYDSTGTHPGTWVYHALGTSGVWTAVDAGIDLCFYVDGVPVTVTVNLTGVGADPQIGAGTVEIGSAPVEPPVSPGGGTGAGRPSRTGMRLRPTEDKAVYLKGVSSSPQVGQVMVLHEMQRVYEKYSAPIPKVQTPAEMPPGMRRLFKPVEKPVPPAVFVYSTSFPKLRSAVGTGKVNAFYEDIDEETIAMIDLL